MDANVIDLEERRLERLTTSKWRRPTPTGAALFKVGANAGVVVSFDWRERFEAAQQKARPA